MVGEHREPVGRSERPPRVSGEGKGIVRCGREGSRAQMVLQSTEHQANRSMVLRGRPIIMEERGTNACFCWEFWYNRPVLTEISMTEQCDTGQVPVITRSSRVRSENLFTIGRKKLEKARQPIVSVEEISRMPSETSFRGVNVVRNLAENTSGFSTYIG